MASHTNLTAAPSRIIGVALSALMLSGLLAACGGGNDTSGPALTRAQETEALDKAVRKAREANAVKVKGERARATTP